MKKTDMLQGNPGKSLLIFAMPMILGNLFQQFYNMTDSLIVGRFVGEDALAAVGASYSLTTVFIMIAIGGGMGASVLTSQYLGAGQHGKMKTSVYTALITFLILSILLTVFGPGHESRDSPGTEYAGKYIRRRGPLSADLLYGTAVSVYVQYSLVRVQRPGRIKNSLVFADFFFNF